MWTLVFWKKEPPRCTRKEHITKTKMKKLDVVLWVKEPPSLEKRKKKPKKSAASLYSYIYGTHPVSRRVVRETTLFDPFLGLDRATKQTCRRGPLSAVSAPYMRYRGCGDEGHVGGATETSTPPGIPFQLSESEPRILQAVRFLKSEVEGSIHAFIP